ncbi:MAG: metallophosphoesterase family protein [Rhodovibrionaceae bacterium]
MGRAPENSRVYAIGDIHGEAEMLEALHARILGDAAEHQSKRKVAVYLGDYVDRGTESQRVIELLLSDPLPGFETVHLKGNHEAAFEGFMENPEGYLSWLSFGGVSTCASYGVDAASPPEGADMLAWLRDALREKVPQAHKDFLAGLPLCHQEGDYFFAHAGVKPGVGIEAQAAEDLLWIRDAFLNSDQDHGKIVVHGHTPEWSPVKRSNRIGIDTGACYGGALTALVLDGDSQSFLQVS